MRNLGRIYYYISLDELDEDSLVTHFTTYLALNLVVSFYLTMYFHHTKTSLYIVYNGRER